MLIKKNRTSPFIVLLLALSLSAITQASAQEAPQRERRVSTTHPVATPQQTPTPRSTPKPSVTPTPQVSVAPSVQANAPKTVEELRARIEEVLHSSELSSAQMAVKV